MRHPKNYDLTRVSPLVFGGAFRASLLVPYGANRPKRGDRVTVHAVDITKQRGLVEDVWVATIFGAVGGRKCHVTCGVGSDDIQTVHERLSRMKLAGEPGADGGVLVYDEMPGADAD